jgi:ankyrin repeat protein
MCAVLAAREGHTAVMDLLTSNMDVNGHRGMLLSSAAGHGEAGTVQHLIKRGADVNAEAGKALYLASSYGHETTVRVLLHHGADPNLGAHNNALGAAARGHHASICAMLIRSGAAVQTTDHAQLLLAAARDCKDQELHTLLAERGITSLPTGPSDRT